MINIGILAAHVKYRATEFYLLDIVAHVKYTTTVFYFINQPPSSSM